MPEFVSSTNTPAAPSLLTSLLLLAGRRRHGRGRGRDVAAMQDLQHSPEVEEVLHEVATYRAPGLTSAGRYSLSREAWQVAGGRGRGRERGTAAPLAGLPPAVQYSGAEGVGHLALLARTHAMVIARLVPCDSHMGTLDFIDFIDFIVGCIVS